MARKRRTGKSRRGKRGLIKGKDSVENFIKQYPIPTVIFGIGILVGLAFLIKYIVDEATNGDTTKSPTSSPTPLPVVNMIKNPKVYTLEKGKEVERLRRLRNKITKS